MMAKTTKPERPPKNLVSFPPHELVIRAKVTEDPPRPTSFRQTPLAPGIRRHGAGWQATVKVRGERAYQQFDLDEKLSIMIEWQKDARADLRRTLPKIKGGSFAADAKKYLALSSVTSMPTYAERCQHILEWVDLFGGRRRRAITALDIEAQRDHWFLTSRGIDAETGKPLPPFSAASVNKRLRALSNLWTKLDTRRAPNPVLEVDECEEPDPVARGLPYDVIEAILQAIPDTAVGVKKDGTRTTGKNIPRPSQTKARLRVIAYTGLSHGQLMTLTPTDVDLEAGTVRLTARRKGKKRRRAADRPIPQLLPLIEQAVEAFKEYDRLKCWGRFSQSSMWKAFQRACRTLGLQGLRPYDLRHSMGSMIYGETRDLRVTGMFLGHRSDRTTKRYTLSALSPHVADAARKVREGFARIASQRRNG